MLYNDQMINIILVTLRMKITKVVDRMYAQVGSLLESKKAG